jgi:hypothetical protein
VCSSAGLGEPSSFCGSAATGTTSFRTHKTRIRQSPKTESHRRHWALHAEWFELLKLEDKPLLLSDSDRKIKVRATFLETVKVSGGAAVYGSKKALVEDWAKRFPIVSEILKKRDSIGSLKPVLYDLLAPDNRKDLKLQEELVLLWSADRMKIGRIGDTTLMPPASFPIRIEGDTSLMTPIPFSDQIVDVQYRGMNGGADLLISKIILQILYIRDQGRHILLGGFLIVSKSDGEFEFHLVPRDFLEQTLID